MKVLRWWLFATLASVVLTGTLGWADDNDPPGRAARLQYVTGSVSVQPEGNGDWVEATLNRPLTNADNVWADKDARAELNVGTGIIRLNGETSLTLTNVSDNAVQVQVHQGTVSLRIRKLYGGEIYEVDTPNMAFTIQKSGEYRFDVDPNGDASYVTVWKGEGDATGEGRSVRVRERERVRFTNGNSLAYNVSPAPGFDGFDDWGHVRDRREGSVSARYVSPDVIGYEDLDEYGYWETAPTYGSIWVPRHVAVGWAPYRYGHWVWVGPWGWTWVDDAPWGFAPFHYGRWVYTGGYWGWAPGPVYVRPVYAPALVAWFGGSHWGVGASFGGGVGYGWCPLGWNEPFVPWYRGSRNYYRNVNITNTRITNVTVINNYYGGRGGPIHYANLRSPGGVTAVSENAIRNSMRVNRVAVNVPAKQFERASLGGRVDLSPDRNSRLGVNAGRPAALPPQRSFARPVVSNMHPTARVGSPESGRNVERVPMGAGHPEARSQRPNDAREAGEANLRNVPRPGNPSQPGRLSSTPSTSVPHPPDREHTFGGQNQEPRSGARSSSVPVGNVRGDSNQNPAAGRNVPRPPDNGSGMNRPNSPQHLDSRPDMRSGARSQSMPAQQPMNDRGANSRPTPAERSVPRPAPDRGGQGREQHPNLQSHPSSPPANGRPNNMGMNVPRPTGRVLPAANYSRSGSPHVGRDQMAPSFAGNGQIGRSSSPSYGGNNRSYSAPQERGRASTNRSMSSYSAAPSYRAESPSYRSAAPSYRAASPSYRSAAPSYRAASPSYRSAAPSYQSAGSYRSSGAGNAGAHQFPGSSQGRRR